MSNQQLPKQPLQQPIPLQQQPYPPQCPQQTPPYHQAPVPQQQMPPYPQPQPMQQPPYPQTYPQSAQVQQPYPSQQPQQTPPQYYQAPVPQQQRPMQQHGVIPPGKHHIHPAFVVLNVIRVVLGILVAIVISAGQYLNEELTSELGDKSTLVIGLIIVGLVVILVVSLIFAYIYYKRFLWELTQSDIHLYSGILFKKQVHIPFQKVQSIDFHSGIIERILGIVRLKIETAGGASNTGEVIPALKLAQAEALRAEVFARKRSSERQHEAQMQQKMQAARAAMGTQGADGITDPGAAVGTGTAVGTNFGNSQAMGAAVMNSVTATSTHMQAPSGADNFVREVGDSVGGLRGIFADNYAEDARIEHEHGLTAKQLLLSAISSDHSFLTFVIIIAFVSQLGGFLALLNLEEFAEEVVSTTIANFAGPALVVLVIILGVVLYLLGTVGVAIQYGGFKCRRRAGRIEVEMGLLARQSKGVSINRVQSVEIKQGFIRKLFGYGELRLLTVDSIDTNQQQQGGQAIRTPGLLIHPFIKVAQIPTMLNSLLPEYNLRPQESEFRRLPKIALRRVIVRHVVIFLVFYAILAAASNIIAWLLFGKAEPQIFMWFTVVIWALLVILLIIKSIAAALWYKHAAYSFNADMLVLRSGFFSVTTTIIPRKKIQWASFKQNPFQRMAKVATIAAVTAAGVGGTTTKLRDLDVGEAQSFIDWLRPRAKS